MGSSLIVSAILSLGLLSYAHAALVMPYTSGSAADNILKFNNGAAGTVTAPNAPSTLIGVTYNNTLASGTGGGWAITAQGSTGVWAAGLVTARSNAQTNVSSNALNFQTVTSGLSSLLGVSLTMNWSGSSTVTGSNTWDSLGSTSYVYQFDANLNNSFVSGAVDLFGSIKLEIKAGATTLYSQTGLAQILGVTSITNTTYNNAQVGFTYNQALGPLTITWSATSALNTQLLSLLGGNTQTFYQVSDTAIYVNAIPEPSFYSSIALGLGGLYLGKRYRRLRHTSDSAEAA